jgi:hypothetical protein
MEPWIFPENFTEGHVGVAEAEKDGLHVVRMNSSRSSDGLLSMEFHYLVGTADGVEHFTEVHDVRLFPRSSYERAMDNAGLQHEFDEEGLFGRGLFVGTKPG